MSENDKIKILFVDDDTHLLKALRRNLRDMRHEWDMEFVDSGAAALTLLEKSPVDVVVSDMRMPEMDGAELLHKVSKLYPSTIRIVLSGYAENEAVNRTVGPSHQYLAKPCDPDALINIVQRSIALRETLSTPELRNFVTGMQSLPSIPSAYRAFIAAVSNPLSTTDTVVATIEHDIGLVTQILKLTNSAYFALPMKITNLRQAVQVLGFETIRSLVTMSSFFTEFMGLTHHAGALETLSQRSSTIGGLARDIARSSGLNESEIDQACCAGMLAHVGTLILITNVPDGFDNVIRQIDGEHASLLDLERKVFSATHAEVGACFLGLWGFSHPVVESVLYHHDPINSPEENFGIIGAVHAAQALARFLDTPNLPSPEELSATLDTAYLQRMGKTDIYDNLYKLIDRRRQKAAAMA
jgi:HD-like signal output (HDOD) protein